MIPQWKIYPRPQGHSTVYLQNVVTDPAITVGDYTFSTTPGTFSETTYSTTTPSTATGW